jgi:hypothetical protein
VGVAVLTAPAVVQATEIDHKAVGCVVAEHFPRLEARLNPADSVGRARIFFRTEGGPSWYAVAMKREGDVFLAALPKPKKSLSSSTTTSRWRTRRRPRAGRRSTQRTWSPGPVAARRA